MPATTPREFKLRAALPSNKTNLAILGQELLRSVDARILKNSLAPSPSRKVVDIIMQVAQLTTKKAARRRVAGSHGSFAKED